MARVTHIFRNLTKSKFVRSIFLQVLSIFLVVSIAIVAIVFFSFASEINKSIIEDRQNQLALIEETISKRMAEISSIAYHVSNDSSFYLEQVSGEGFSGYEMSKALSRYLVGNSFIEHLAYYRLSEPDKLYVSSGELSFSDFWSIYLHVDKETAEQYTQGIRSTTRVSVVPLAFDDIKKSYFAYVCPIPQFTANPQAFVLVMIPFSEVVPLFESQLEDTSGMIATYDADGNEIYRISTLGEEVPYDLAELKSTDGESYVRINGGKYVVQKQVSDSNGWTFVSVMRLNDMISGLANRQLLFIVLLLVLMLLAVFVMLVCIIAQYSPIETVYRDAEAANKAKSAFLSSMSHDIRTPMNAIIGMTTIAAKHADDTENVRECLDKVQVASKYLMDIINNVLDMSRIESGKFTLAEETVELPKLVHGILTMLDQSAENKRQRLTVELEHLRHERVIGDSVRLSQVFVNILSNSVKFTPDGGEIRLSIAEADSVEAGFGEYVFTFTDTGIGMSPEYVAHVFDTFSRAPEGGGSRVEGTGLGMAIAKNLVELMGGTIRCESELGLGTTFTVSLRMPIVDAGQPEPDCSGMAVLIAGGGEEAGNALMKAFTEIGARADVAASLPEAADMAGRRLSEGDAYRLVVFHSGCDLDAIEEITRAAKAADTVCALAVREPAEVRQTEARQAGVDVFVQLPLFRSTAVRLLARTFDEAESAVQPYENAVDLTGRRVLLPRITISIGRSRTRYCPKRTRRSSRRSTERPLSRRLPHTGQGIST